MEMMDTRDKDILRGVGWFEALDEFEEIISFHVTIE